MIRRQGGIVLYLLFFLGGKKLLWLILLKKDPLLSTLWLWYYESLSLKLSITTVNSLNKQYPHILCSLPHYLHTISVVWCNTKYDGNIKYIDISADLSPQTHMSGLQSWPYRSRSKCIIENSSCLINFDTMKTDFTWTTSLIFTNYVGHQIFVMFKLQARGNVEVHLVIHLCWEILTFTE